MPCADHDVGQLELSGYASRNAKGLNRLQHFGKVFWELSMCFSDTTILYLDFYPQEIKIMSRAGETAQQVKVLIKFGDFKLVPGIRVNRIWWHTPVTSALLRQDERWGQNRSLQASQPRIGSSATETRDFDIERRGENQLLKLFSDLYIWHSCTPHNNSIMKNKGK